MSVTVKCFLEHTDGSQEIRRFSSSFDNLLSYKYLMKSVFKAYGCLGGKSVKASWIDPEGDRVVFSSDRELAEALGFREGNMFKVYLRVCGTAGKSHKFSGNKDLFSKADQKSFRAAKMKHSCDGQPCKSCIRMGILRRFHAGATEATKAARAAKLTGTYTAEGGVGEGLRQVADMKGTEDLAERKMAFLTKMLQPGGEDEGLASEFARKKMAFLAKMTEPGGEGMAAFTSCSVDDRLAAHVKKMRDFVALTKDGGRAGSDPNGPGSRSRLGGACGAGAGGLGQKGFGFRGGGMMGDSLGRAWCGFDLMNSQLAEAKELAGKTGDQPDENQAAEGVVRQETGQEEAVAGGGAALFEAGELTRGDAAHDEIPEATAREASEEVPAGERSEVPQMYEHRGDGSVCGESTVSGGSAMSREFANSWIQMSAASTGSQDDQLGVFEAADCPGDIAGERKEEVRAEGEERSVYQKIDDAVEELKSMGFHDREGWLTRAVIKNEADIDKVLSEIVSCRVGAKAV